MLKAILVLSLLMTPITAYAGPGVEDISEDRSEDNSDTRTMFDFSLTFAIEQDLPFTNPLDVANPDPTHSFLRDMGMSTAEIGRAITDAESFFLQRFGLDFTHSIPDGNGIKWIDGAMLFPYRFPDHVNYRIVSASTARLKESIKVNDGGFMVMLTGPVTFHGDFGGVVGKPGFQGDIVLSAWYRIDEKIDRHAHGKKPLIIRAISAGPMRTNVDGDTSINCEVIHPKFGKGNAEGMWKLRPKSDGTARLGVRNVLTFPAR